MLPTFVKFKVCRQLSSSFLGSGVAALQAVVGDQVGSWAASPQVLGM